MKLTILISLLSLVFGCIQHDKARSTAISIRLSEKVNENDWLIVDNLIFLHKSMATMDSVRFYDSIRHGKPMKVFIVPTSVHKIVTPNGKLIREEISDAFILSYLARGFGIVNEKDSTYLMNLGANLWLNNELELKKNGQFYIENGQGQPWKVIRK